MKENRNDALENIGDSINSSENIVLSHTGLVNQSRDGLKLNLCLFH